MAQIVPTITPLGGGRGGVKVVWEGMATGDTGGYASFSQYKDKCVTVEGTVTTFALQGRNHPSDSPRTLEDTDGTAITVAGIYQLKENPTSIRPNLTTGSSVRVTMECR